MKSFFAIAVTALLAVLPVVAQPPQMAPGTGDAPQDSTNNPGESSAYAAAMALPDPASRVMALRHFIVTYPNSGMRQSAISQLMLAQRQTRGSGTSPLGTTPHMAVGQPAAAAAPPPSEPAPVQAAQAPGPQRDSLLQQAAKPAEVTVAPHSLVIKADNSELSAILHQIAGSTGMKIDGLSKDERVFGSYGPGNARDVLLALLEGSGYNVIMVGTTPEGAPRQLSLTQRAASATQAVGAVARNGNEEDSDDSEQDVQQSPPPEAPIQQQLPGSQQGSEAGPQQPPRSPQEILQELQRQRMQQQNQNPQ